MPSEEYHLNRYHAHRKWAKRHLLITGVSLLTFVGILWAWIPAIKWLQHRRKAKAEKANAEEAAVSE
jgi:hypothetical protein